MAVILINSNSSPATLSGAYGTTVTPPAFVTSSTQSQAGAPAPINPVQVIGLVPVFPCCNPSNSLGGFSFSLDGVCSMTYQLSIGGHNYGNFTTASTNPTTIAAAINAILTGSGYSVTCSIVGSVCFAIISGGVTSAVVSLTYVSGCGKVMSTTNISKGGTDCLNCDCREGLYKADTIPNDQNYTLPVFADFTCSDSYHNDSNTWVFQYPGTYNPILSSDFRLQQLIGGIWTNVATLNNANFGTTIYTGTSCASPQNYGGYTLNWALVLQNLGEGTFRFTVNGNGTNKVPYCLQSPPFCLKTYDCHAVDGTVKFETVQSGGNWGSVSTQGLSWSLCCVNRTTQATTPIIINDSIRFFGFFGKNKPTLQRDQVKYAPGVIVKNRDEAIKHFTFESSQLPQWLHERFYAYVMMADQTYVSDYNINNSDYNFKHFWIAADGDYAPKYVGATRYPKVMDVKFVEGQQFTFRDRCCS